MRLTEDQIKEGILHENIIARSVVLHHYSGSYSQDPSVLALAVQAVEAHGWSGLVDFYFKSFDGLAVTAETASWIVDQLGREKDRQAAQWDAFRRALLACLLQADVEILRPLRDEIVPLEILALRDRQKLNLRLEWSTRSPQACWQELEDLAEQCASAEGDRFPHTQVRRAEAVISELAPRAGEFADRVLELLAPDLGDEGPDPRLWVQGMMIILSGRMRLAAAAPLLIKRLHDDWDWYSEACQTSLKRIGGNAALDAICEDYATVPWHVRLYATGALETLRVEGATERLARLAELQRELAADGDDSSLLFSGICSGLAHQFETPALHLARELVIEYDDDPEVQWTRREVVGASLVMGESIPELDEWKEDVEHEMKQQQSWYGGGPHFAGGSKPLPGAPSIFDAAAKAPRSPAPVETHYEAQTAVQPITRSGTRVGRNDPCPCGSGKKYKKCCMRKDGGTGP